MSTFITQAKLLKLTKMKRIKNFISIAFLLVVGATFATQINGAVDYFIALDYTAIGMNIQMAATKAYELVVSLVDFVSGLFDQASDKVEVIQVSDVATSTVD